MAVSTEEMAMVRDTVRAWVQEQSPVSAFRRLRDASDTLGYVPSVYAAMAEMGWPGAAIPESYGGSELGYTAAGVILEEAGRTLTAAPLLTSAIIGATALLRAGSEAQKAAYLPRIATGELVCALASDEGPRHAPDRIGLTADRIDKGYRLNGRKWFVLEGMAADLLIVVARIAGQSSASNGISVFLVPTDTPGITRQPLHMIDGRGAADIGFVDVDIGMAGLLGTEGAGAALLDIVLDHARAGIAAEMLGVASQAFDMTIDYLKTRVQFGQPIGSFQALQHRAVKMYGELELARSCVEAALAACDADSPDLAELASLAKAKVGEVLFLISNELLQIHGGIGMTDEHDAGLYLKRARVLEASFGGRAFHRDRFALRNGF